jgi:hypothetical protein
MLVNGRFDASRDLGERLGDGRVFEVPPQHRRCSSRVLAKLRHGGEEFAQLDGFPQPTMRAQGGCLRFRVAVCGDHDDRQRRQSWIVSHFLQKLRAIHLGHHEVQKDEAGEVVRFAQFTNCDGTIGGDPCVIASVLERLGDGIANIVVVLDDQDLSPRAQGRTLG